LRTTRTAITTTVATLLPAMALLLAWALVVCSLVSCSRDANAPVSRSSDAPTGRVTVSGDDRIARTLTWQAPGVTLPVEPIAQKDAAVRSAVDRFPVAHKLAAAALAAGHLYADGESAIPVYLALLKQAPDDTIAQAGLQRALNALLAMGATALDAADDDSAALRDAHQIAAVARTTAPTDKAVQDYLRQVDRADQLWDLNRQAEDEISAGHLGESGGGALAILRTILHLKPHQSRALQGLAAVESGMLRRAEAAGLRGDFIAADRWIAVAARVRPGSTATVADARTRMAVMRSARIEQLHDEGMRALLQRTGIAFARGKLAEILRIAAPGDPVAAELQQRIELAAHYGLFRPGQSFTDGLKLGARGPTLLVVPHGGFRMGAKDGEDDGDDEKPAHYVRFDRGFAMARTEITVDQFREFVQSSGYQPTATRRGYSMVYEERSGNFVRRNGIDWQSTYDGARPGDDLPVAHVSAHDAEAYADWLSRQSGQRYRLPSEAEFEYALRAGHSATFPWGGGAPPAGAGNLTGSRDVSPGGRHWNDAFHGYGDGFWGPAPVGHFDANAYGLHDLAGNVSEWVGDCWHDGYRRAPDNGASWLNPGCQMRVVRGGSWASAPSQTRSAWRAPVGVDTTNARTGFRVVRQL
jgi:formylglycine-generating enzyme required for sulfatase activity